MDGSQKLGCVLGVPSGDTTPALEVQKSVYSVLKIKNTAMINKRLSRALPLHAPSRPGK